MDIALHGVTGIHLGRSHDIDDAPLRRMTITTTHGEPLEIVLFPAKEDPANLTAYFWDDDFPQRGKKLEHLVAAEGF